MKFMIDVPYLSWNSNPWFPFPPSELQLLDVDNTNVNKRHSEELLGFRNLTSAVSWVDFKNLDGDEVIKFALVRGISYKRNEKTKYACRNEVTGEPLDNRSEFPTTNNPFNFNTLIHTKLNILIIGDSLAIEFGSWFQNAAGAVSKTILHSLEWDDSHREEGMAVADVYGGGTIAYWRILGFWIPEGKRRALPNRGGKGWRVEWLRTLESHFKRRGSGVIDVLVFRLSHPWVRTKHVTKEVLQNMVDYARSTLGENLTLIIQTAPMNNNLITVDDFTKFQSMNNLVRSFVWNLNDPKVYLSDVGQFMDNIVKWNAKYIGMDVRNESYILDVMNTSQKRYKQHIAQVCSERVRHESNRCRLNMISHDGMHFCMETLGPRLFANWACIMQCSSSVFVKEEAMQYRNCEKACHENYFQMEEPRLRILEGIK